MAMLVMPGTLVDIRQAALNTFVPPATFLASADCPVLSCLALTCVVSLEDLTFGFSFSLSVTITA